MAGKPDRIRIDSYQRITVLKALKLYIESLTSSPFKERQDWPEAMAAWKIAKSLALRTKGRRQRWFDDVYFDADSGKPLKEIQSWIDELEAHYGLKQTPTATVASPPVAPEASSPPPV